MERSRTVRGSCLGQAYFGPRLISLLLRMAGVPVETMEPVLLKQRKREAVPRGSRKRGAQTGLRECDCAHPSRNLANLTFLCLNIVP